MSLRDYLEITYFIVMIVFTPLTVIGLGVYCFLTYKMWQAQLENNQINATNALQQTLTNKLNAEAVLLESQRRLAEAEERISMNQYQISKDQWASLEKLARCIPGILSFVKQKVDGYIRKIVTSSVYSDDPSPSGSSDKE